MLCKALSSLLLPVSFMTLLACGGSGGGTSGAGGASGATTSATTAGATTTSTTSGVGTGGMGGMSGTGGGPCDGKIIKGTITYAGTAGPNDVVRVAVVKDGKPGIPSGFNQYPAPVFPLDYEITGLPVDPAAGFTNYGLIAYLDYGGDDFMGPGADDPQYVSMELVKVTACEGATLDFDLPELP